MVRSPPRSVRQQGEQGDAVGLIFTHLAVSSAFFTGGLPDAAAIVGNFAVPSFPLPLISVGVAARQACDNSVAVVVDFVPP